MVFLFGYDVPIVEVVVALACLSVLILLLLLVSLRRTKETNKKLDRLMQEEKQFKEELDATKQEEDQQLSMMRTIVKELHTLTAISAEEHEGFAAVQRLARRASKHVKRGTKALHPDAKQALLDLATYVDKLDDVSKRENAQLDTINRILSRLRR